MKMILRANQHKKMPWKNGGGYTQEIAREPDNDAIEFDWRLSIASVSFPGGQFSVYPEIDRTLCILEGKNITLQLNNDTHQLVRLDEDSVPYSFSGDIPITCQINENSITDFNVMTRRNKCQHVVQTIVLTTNQNYIDISYSRSETLFIVIAKGNLLVNESQMTKGDAMKFNGDDQLIKVSSLTDDARFFVVRIMII